MALNGPRLLARSPRRSFYIMRPMTIFGKMRAILGNFENTTGKYPTHLYLGSAELLELKKFMETQRQPHEESRTSFRKNLTADEGCFGMFDKVKVMGVVSDSHLECS